MEGVDDSGLEALFLFGRLLGHLGPYGVRHIVVLVEAHRVVEDVGWVVVCPPLMGLHLGDVAIAAKVLVDLFLRHAPRVVALVIAAQRLPSTT